jgi:RHS repeat-associated protein
VDGAKLALMNGTAVSELFVALPGGNRAIYTASGLTYYQYANWLGSERITTTPQTTIVHDGMYAPFGEVYNETGVSGLRNFTGQNNNLATDLYDFPARAYHPIEGRWIQPDAAGIAAVDFTNPQSWNRYGYVLGNPLAYRDPSGMILEAPQPAPPATPAVQINCSWLAVLLMGNGAGGSGLPAECGGGPAISISMLQPGGGGGSSRPAGTPPKSGLTSILKTKIGQVPQTCLAPFSTNRGALTRTAGQIRFYNGATDKGNLYMFYKPSQYALPQYSFQNVNATRRQTRQLFWGRMACRLRMSSFGPTSGPRIWQAKRRRFGMS